MLKSANIERPSNGARLRISTLLQKREKEPYEPGIKINLYRDHEYRALARACSPVRIENSVDQKKTGVSCDKLHIWSLP